MALRLRLLLATAVLGSLPRASSYAPARPGIRPARPNRLRSPCLQADDEPTTVAPTPTASDGSADLSAMSFDERLEYLADKAANAPAPSSLPEDDEGTLFGIDGSKPAT